MNFKKFNKGFTLIELLVVIGILAVLAAGIVALIDPVEKNNQAKDSKVRNDISQIITAMQSYAAQDPAGAYPLPTNWETLLVSSGELTVFPSEPTGSTYSMTGGGVGATTVCGTLLSKRARLEAAAPSTTPAGAAFFKWDSTSGKACVRPTCATGCP